MKHKDVLLGLTLGMVLTALCCGLVQSRYLITTEGNLIPVIYRTDRWTGRTDVSVGARAQWVTLVEGESSDLRPWQSWVSYAGMLLALVGLMTVVSWCGRHLRPGVGAALAIRARRCCVNTLAQAWDWIAMRPLPRRPRPLPGAKSELN